MVFLFFFRLRVLLFIAMVTLGAGGFIVFEVKHRFDALETTATLLERISKCRVLFNADAQTQTIAQTIAAAARAEEIPCETAQAMQDRFGGDRIEIHRRDLVRLSYVGPRGEPREVTTDADVAPKDAAPGAQFSVLYDPDEPDAVRTPAMDIGLAAATAVFTLGLVLFGLALGLSPGRLARRLAKASGVGRVADDKSADWTKSADDAIARALQPAPAPQSAPASDYQAAPARSFGRRAG